MKKIHVLSLLSGALLSCVVMLPVIFIADQWGWIWFMMWIVCFLLFSLAVGYALQGYYARKSGNGVKTSENYLWYVYIFVYFLTSIVFVSLFSVLHDKCYCLLILGGVYLVVTATLVVSERRRKNYQSLKRLPILTLLYVAWLILEYISPYWRLIPLPPPPLLPVSQTCISGRGWRGAWEKKRRKPKTPKRVGEIKSKSQ